MTPKLNEARQWMLGALDDSVDRLNRWCNQNSWSHDLDRLVAMASVLQHDFDTFGVQLRTVELPELRLLGDQEDYDRRPTGPALLWHHNDQASKRILLMIHYDTVYPHASNPNRCRRQGKRLIGPGTADAKGGIAVIAMAIEAIRKFDLAPDIGLSILLNPDEEIGSTASKSLMQELSPQFDAALLFEPTLPDGSLVAARKGSGNFSIVVRGKSAHAGRNPDAGRNAIVHLAGLITRLSPLSAPDQGTLLNIGRIQGGGPLNQVPDHAVVHLNVRVANPAAMDRIQQELQDIVQQFRNADYRVTLQGEFHCPPKQIDQATARLQQLIAIAGAVGGRQIMWKDTGGACDGSKLAAMGLPNIDTLGVTGGDLHSPDEYCELDSLVPAAYTVAVFIANFSRQSN